MPENVLWFADLGLADLDQVGGKTLLPWRDDRPAVGRGGPGCPTGSRQQLTPTEASPAELARRTRLARS